MKQRLLFTLLMLLVSVGFIYADGVTVTVPKGKTATFTFATGKDYKVTVNGEESKSPFTVKAEDTKEGDKDFKILGVTESLKVAGSASKIVCDNAQLKNLEAPSVGLKTLTLTTATGLTTLDVSGNEGMTFPLVVDPTNYPNLATINVSGLKYGQGLNFGSYTKLTTLDVSNNDLTALTVPASIKTLKAGGNKLSTIAGLPEKGVSVTYGKQNNKLTSTSTPKANDWFNMTAFVKEALSLSADPKELAVTWTGKSFEKATDSEGLKYRFWNGTAYEDASTLKGTVTVDKGFVYDFELKIEKAVAKIAIETPQNGTLAVTKANAEVANGTDVTNGDQLTIVPTPKEGFQFDKLTVKGLVKTDVENVYKVAIVRNSAGSEDVVSVAATFKAGNYLLKNLAKASNNGTFTIMNGDKDLTKQPSSAVAYGDEITITVNPLAGFKARVKVDSKEVALTDNAYSFKVSEKEHSIEIVFEQEGTANLTIKCPEQGTNIVTTVNGKPISYGGNDYIGSYTIGSAINITFENTSAGATIEQVLMGTTPLPLNTDKDGKVSVSFKMPKEGAIIKVVRNMSAKVITIIPTDVVDQKVQKYTYDGKDHPFRFTTNPANLTGFDLAYSMDETGKDNYKAPVPNKVGTYYVKITRQADNLYQAVENKDYKVEIEKATPVITTQPKVSINKEDKKYVITVGEANVEGTWEVVNESGNVVEAATEDKSAVVTVRFTPKDEANYTAATVQVTAQSSDKDSKVDLFTVKFAVPTEYAGITLTVKNGDAVVKSGDKIANGTDLTYILDYPKGYSKVYLYEKSKPETVYGGKTAYSNNQLKATVSRDLDLVVKAEGKAAVTVLKPTLKVAPKEVIYSGSIPALYDAAQDFSYGINDNAGWAKLQNLVKIIYIDENGKELPAPVNAGEYKVKMSWPAFEGDKAYAAFDAIVEGVTYTIKKKELKDADFTWPENAVVAKGQKLSTADFVGGASPVEGAFKFVEGNITPESGKQYQITFVPKDNANYEVKNEKVKKATVVVTDKRTLFISTVVGGKIIVTNGSATLTNGQTLEGVESFKVEAYPETGYELISLTVNGNAITNGATYTVRESDKNITVNAVFSKEFKVSLAGAPLGVVITDKPSSNTVKAGGSYTFSLAALEADMAKIVVKAGGTELKGSKGTYTLSDVKADHVITIALASPTAITVKADTTLSPGKKPMGKVEIQGWTATKKYHYGDEIIVTAFPESGVTFTGWKDMTSKENPLTVTLTKASYVFKAQYKGVPTGIEEIEAAKIYGDKGCIVIRGIADAQVTIVSMDGRAQRVQVSGDSRIDMPAGIYGVVLEQDADQKRVKVIVR